jgi:hypothetical protein
MYIFYKDYGTFHKAATKELMKHVNAAKAIV